MNSVSCFTCNSLQQWPPLQCCPWAESPLTRQWERDRERRIQCSPGRERHRSGRPRPWWGWRRCWGRTGRSWQRRARGGTRGTARRTFNCVDIRVRNIDCRWNCHESQRTNNDTKEKKKQVAIIKLVFALVLPRFSNLRLKYYGEGSNPCHDLGGFANAVKE